MGAAHPPFPGGRHPPSLTYKALASELQWINFLKHFLARIKKAISARFLAQSSKRDGRPVSLMCTSVEKWVTLTWREGGGWQSPFESHLRALN